MAQVVPTIHYRCTPTSDDLLPKTQRTNVPTTHPSRTEHNTPGMRTPHLELSSTPVGQRLDTGTTTKTHIKITTAQLNNPSFRTKKSFTTSKKLKYPPNPKYAIRTNDDNTIFILTATPLQCKFRFPAAQRNKKMPQSR